jgi:hypothetical protein
MKATKRRRWTSNHPKRVAQSVKRSAERSHRRKSRAFRSAMAMLNYFIRRAREELRQLFKKSRLARK